MKSMPHSTIEQVKHFARHKFAWPGGYPMYLVTHDGGVLCHACVRDNFKLILRATRHSDCDGGWMAHGVDINYEDGALHCDDCGARIESAYAEPDSTRGTILISKTYEIITPPADSEGEVEVDECCMDCGFEFEDQPVTFRELVKILEAHPDASCSPCERATPDIWFTSYADTDCRTGGTETTSVHFSRANPARKAKYWNLAARAAGCI